MSSKQIIWNDNCKRLTLSLIKILDAFAPSQVSYQTFQPMLQPQCSKCILNSVHKTVCACTSEGKLCGEKNSVDATKTVTLFCTNLTSITLPDLHCTFTTQMYICICICTLHAKLITTPQLIPQSQNWPNVVKKMLPTFYYCLLVNGNCLLQPQKKNQGFYPL